jgi:hypothetical protein
VHASVWPTLTAHNVPLMYIYYFLMFPETSPLARPTLIGRDNNARIRSLRMEIDGANAHVQSKYLDKFAKNCTKTLLQWNENTFFIEDTHLPQMISKRIISHLITRTANEKPR